MKQKQHRSKAPVANMARAAAQFLHSGNLLEAGRVARMALVANPKDGEAMTILGSVALNTGRLDEAITYFEGAVGTQRRNPLLHFNLGAACLQAQRYEAAAEHFAAASRFKPAFAEAESGRGDALRNLSKWDDALRAYRASLGYSANNPTALNGLGLCQLNLGSIEEAVASLNSALRLVPPQDAKNKARILGNLGLCHLNSGSRQLGLEALVEALGGDPSNTVILCLLADHLLHTATIPDHPNFERVLIRLYAEPAVSPAALASASVLALKQSPAFWPSLQEAGGPLDALSIIGRSQLCLLLLRNAPIPDVDLERALTLLRAQLVDMAHRGELAQLTPHLELITALAHQCFLNEFIYAVEPEEEERLAEALSRPGSNEDERRLLACLGACFRPLQLAEDRLVSAPDCVRALYRQQVDAPRREQEIIPTIAALTSIDDDISAEVRKQYEENPYPRWHKYPLRAPKPFRQAVKQRVPHLSDAQLPLTDSPKVLVGGCGTGLETMNVVTSYQTASILAVDLSRASIAYGMRKLAEYGIDRVEHRQADILHLGQIEERFDHIDSFGVIHHMAEPAAAVQIFANLLNPGGLLYLGLYSTIARTSVVTARDEISRREIPPTIAGIRALRAAVMRGEIDLPNITSPASDFWTASECRDLLFHVKEHRFTVLEVGRLLETAGLEFLGLELPHAADMRVFKLENPDPEAVTSPEAWHGFEERHPDVFGDTYRIWARKPFAPNP